MGERLAAARAATAAAPPGDRLSAEAWGGGWRHADARARWRRPLAEQVARLVGADADFDAVAEALDAAARCCASGRDAGGGGGCVTS